MNLISVFRRATIAAGLSVLGAATLAYAGNIEGTVALSGSAPANKKINMSNDKKCAALHKGETVMTEEYVVNGGKLQWVLVSLKDAKKTPKKLPAATLDQKGCHYVPHVLGLIAGQEVKIKNSDPLLHNIHPLPKVNKEFNISQPTKGMETTRKFDKVESKAFKVKCNVHKWMSAHVAVFDHPYFAVTGADGKFTLKDVPAGSYTVEAWHEKLGTQTMKVTVKASGATKADISFKK